MSDLSPSFDSLPDEDSPVLWDSSEREAAQLITLRRKRTKLDRAKFLEDQQNAYEAVGGYDRLVYEFNKNFSKYYFRLAGNLTPIQKQEVDLNWQIHPALAKSALDEMPKDLTNVIEGSYEQLDQGSD